MSEARDQWAAFWMGVFVGGTACVFFLLIVALGYGWCFR